MIRKLLIAVAVAFVFIAYVASAKVSASSVTEYYNTKFIEMEATAYCYGKITASGSPVREGICAGRKDWIGKCALVYLQEEDGSLGDFVGYFEIKDTGGDYRIKSGRVIDIYMLDKEECVQWGRRKVLVQIVEAQG